MIYRNSRTMEIPNVDILMLLFGMAYVLFLHADATNQERCIIKSQARNLTKWVAHGLRYEYGVGASGPGKDVVMVMYTGQVLLPVLFYGVIAAGGIYSVVSALGPVRRTCLVGFHRIQHLDMYPGYRSGRYQGRQVMQIARIKDLRAESSAELNLRNLSTGRNCVSERQLNWTKITNPSELENSLVCLLALLFRDYWSSKRYLPR
jgi:4-coumarate--CoA ligase